MNFDNVALHVPDILLPRPGIDLSKWAVIACDQYTSQPEYWEKVKEFTNGSPSSFELIFPEVYLKAKEKETIIAGIKSRMHDYLKAGIITLHHRGFILIDRKTAHTSSRKGLLAALDLEQYDFSPRAKSLIRATEETVTDRLPPRIKIREDAQLEIPHIMVLIDDPGKTVIEPLFGKKLKKIYDFDLMLESGHLTGYQVDEQAVIAETADKLAGLANPALFKEKYNVSEEDILLYAVGDGNHSLATAKVIWEQFKKIAPDKQTVMKHPARYVLVELVNLHDEGLIFEPIHRLLFQIDSGKLLKHMSCYFKEAGASFSYEMIENKAEWEQRSELYRRDKKQSLPFMAGGKYGIAVIENPVHQLAVAALQRALDSYMESNPSLKIDYVHGEEAVSALALKEGNLGFYCPPFPKEKLFRTILLDGSLPRKTFSMGEADEKRFYLECRKIV